MAFMEFALRFVSGAGTYSLDVTGYEGSWFLIASAPRVLTESGFVALGGSATSYAKQSKDDQLRILADRIQAPAIRRCGELLKSFHSNGGRPSKTNNDSDVSFSQKQAATKAGLSQRQRETAIRVSNIPEEDFEAAVESERPVTVSQLAERGKKSQPKPLVNLNGRDPLVDTFTSLATPLFDLVTLQLSATHNKRHVRLRVTASDGPGGTFTEVYPGNM